MSVIFISAKQISSDQIEKLFSQEAELIKKINSETMCIA